MAVNKLETKTKTSVDGRSERAGKVRKVVLLGFHLKIQSIDIEITPRNKKGTCPKLGAE